jgi:predicted CXXCH cytochrome family protein
MRTLRIGLLAVCCTLAWAPPASAIDAPHDASFTTGTCENCHKIHNATGSGTLVSQADNNTLCTSCHNPLASTPSGARLGLPWNTEDQAFPGKSGQQHRWDALAATPAYGAKAPTDTEMLKRIRDGRIQCAACHDAHADVKAFDPTAMHVSIAAATNTAVTGGNATMGMTLIAPTVGAPANNGYRLQVEFVQSTTQFRLAISHDRGANWLVRIGTAWSPGALGTGSTLYSTGTSVTLDDAAVVVTFTGTPSLGQYWDFYISYAHLRANNVADAMCLQCHADRKQDHNFVEGVGATLGTTIFSHPVGVSLNINGKNYDRGNVLDASGVNQINGDGNPTNNLTLDGSGFVQCTTCHNVHNADSNSLTTDAR